MTMILYDSNRNYQCWSSWGRDKLAKLSVISGSLARRAEFHCSEIVEVYEYHCLAYFHGEKVKVE